MSNSFSITQKLELSISEKFKVFYEQELNKKLEKERIDVTLPGKYISMGHVHPLTSTTNEIVSIFQSLGFSVVANENSPEVETEYFNFDMLNYTTSSISFIFNNDSIAVSVNVLQMFRCTGR